MCFLSFAVILPYAFFVRISRSRFSFASFFLCTSSSTPHFCLRCCFLWCFLKNVTSLIRPAVILNGLGRRSTSNIYGAPLSELSSTDARTWKRLILAKTDSRVIGIVMEVTTVPGSVPEKMTFLREERCSLIAGSKFIYFGDRQIIKRSNMAEETTKLFKPYVFYVVLLYSFV